jgi:hypothetical protein
MAFQPPRRGRFHRCRAAAAARGHQDSDAGPAPTSSPGRRSRRPRSHLLRPRPGARLSAYRPLRVRWRRDPRAHCYNVQLYYGRRKAFRAWPLGLGVRIPAEVLAPGHPTLVVWSGLGPPRRARYARTPWVAQRLTVIGRPPGGEGVSDGEPECAKRYSPVAAGRQSACVSVEWMPHPLGIAPPALRSPRVPRRGRPQAVVGPPKEAPPTASPGQA